AADALDATGQHVEQRGRNERFSRDGQQLMLAVVGIVLVAELHLTIFDVQKTIVGDGDGMSVASDVVEDLLGSGKGWFGIDHPFCIAKGVEISDEGSWIVQLKERGKEMQLSGVEGLLQQLEKQAAE